MVRIIAENKYEIVAGERRWRAAQLAQLATIPVIIKVIDNKSAMAMALIENIQREDLNALEESEALQNLIDLFNLTHQQAGEMVGKSRVTVSNLLRLADLNLDVKSLLSQGLLGMGQARALLSLKEDEQIEIANQIIQQGLSVRASEKSIKSLQQKSSTQQVAQKDTEIIKLEQDLTEKIGSEINIQHKKNGNGQLIIRYHSLDELDGIIEQLRASSCH